MKLQLQDGWPTRIRTYAEPCEIEALRAGDATPCATDSDTFAELALIVAAWPRLSLELRQGIVAMVRSVFSGKEFAR